MPQMIAGYFRGAKRLPAAPKRLLSSLGLEPSASHTARASCLAENNNASRSRACSGQSTGAWCLADEPTGNLDEATSQTLFLPSSLSWSGAKAAQRSLVATHNERLANADGPGGALA